MGNPKFRFSEIIPNAWFHKLNHHRRHKPHPPPSQTPPPSTTATQLQGELPLSLPPLYNPLSPPRKSYYFTREFHPPLKSSSSGRRKHPTTTTTTTRYSPVSSRNCRADSLIIDEEGDVVIKVDKKSLGRRKTGDSVSSVPSVELRPIRTERNKFSNAVKRIAGPQEAAIDDDPIKQIRSSPRSRGRRANGSFSVNVVREGMESIPASSVFSMEQEQRCRSVRRSSTGSPRFRIRVHSPRRIARRAQMHFSRSSLSSSHPKKGVSAKSLAVVKSSSDPQRDFRESMVEMIVENKITAPKDLEELLACYLSLNSEQYHDVITEVFAQIWFDLNNILKEIKK